MNGLPHIVLVVVLVLVLGRSAVFAQQLTDEQILQRIDALQKELDELRAMLKQRANQPTSTNPSQPQPIHPITTSAPIKFRIGGFVQLRAFDDQTTTNAPKRLDQFSVRRVRIEANGDLSPKFCAKLPCYETTLKAAPGTVKQGRNEGAVATNATAPTLRP